ncbi:MAG: HAMP domain-containing sensor histidine kinase [Patescibacteria group bacterium]
MAEETKSNWQDIFNLKKVCSRYRVDIWQCPQVLFLVMGFIIIGAILVTYELTKTYQEPEIAALIVLAVSAILFVIGQIIVTSFERIAESSLAKSEFVSIMSHQLRSPMSSIKWQLNMLISEDLKSNSATEKLFGFLEGIYDQNEKMIRCVSDLLEVNRIEDKDIALKPEFFSISALTEKVIDEYKKDAAMANVNISSFFQPDVPLSYADQDRIKKVIEHLLDNAIRYSLSGGEVNISIEKRSNNIIWKITDQGAGIPKEDKKRVFEKFFRSQNAARYKSSGSGIGLFIAKSIIKLSGGAINFASDENKGSTFWFSLPIKKIQ